MAKILVIGAGGVSSVCCYKMAKHADVFDDILLASRTKSKCDKIADYVYGELGVKIETAQIDADDVEALCRLMDDYKPELCVHLALPYQDLSIMEACLRSKVHYLDTANYEPKDVAKFEYHWQWAYHDRFKDAGLMALLGCGFDPGVTGAFTSYAAKHHFDEIHFLDIVDCNGGDHGKAFATNFNPEINIREITQKGKYYENGEWIEVDAFSIMKKLRYPEIGVRDSYLLYHEELESLVKHFPSLRRARFWMTFGQEYLTHLRVIENLGLSSIEPIDFQGHKVIPLEFLKELLPDPGSLGENYSGMTSIGCRIKGVKDGQGKTYYIYNNCSHADAFEETGAQAVSYTTGVPAMIGAMLMLTKKWMQPGVFNIEQMDPDPFLEDLSKNGLEWHEMTDIDLEL